jgi:hypothetical protein
LLHTAAFYLYPVATGNAAFRRIIAPNSRRVRWLSAAQWVVLDMDSTEIPVYGEQETLGVDLRSVFITLKPA